MKRILLAAFVAICLTPSHRTDAQIVEGVVAAGTISQFIGELSDLANQIQEGASVLLAQGNDAAAQQQMLLPGILKQTISQIEEAYAGSLEKTIDGLSVVDQNAFTNLQTQIESVQGLVDASSAEVQQAIYQAQGAANQILDRLPLVDKFPVFYGATVGDLSPELGDNPADIELLGFLLSDPRIDRKPPEISVDGVVMEDSAVSVREDRIHVQVPRDLKEKLGIANDPCNPRRSFPIILTTYFAEEKGWWIFKRTNEKSVEFRANALAAPDRYDIEIESAGVRTTQTWEEKPFTTEPQYRNVGCERGNNAAARFEAPANARRIQCVAEWTGLNNLKLQNASCAVGGTTVTGTGYIHGRDREWGNCPGGGHAYFILRGTYEEPVDSRSDVTPGSQVFESNTPLDFETSLGIPADLSDVAVHVSIRKHQCEKELDRIDFLAVRPELRTEQTGPVTL